MRLRIQTAASGGRRRMVERKACAGIRMIGLTGGTGGVVEMGPSGRQQLFPRTSAGASLLSSTTHRWLYEREQCRCDSLVG